MSNTLTRFTTALVGGAMVLAMSFAAAQAAPKADKNAKADPLPPHPLQANAGFDKSDGPLVKLPIEYPNPAFAGTPKNVPLGARMLKPTGKARPDFYAPKGLTNVALHKTVTSSDANPIIGSLDLVTDGDKEALDGRWVELAPGKQWVQIDLGKDYDIFVVLLWHNHVEARVYHDVVVMVSDDPQFKKDVHIIYNNDHANVLGFGAGDGYEYFESYEGFLIPVKHGVKARYVRCYSNGNTSDDQNHYAEVEVWGK